MNAPSPFSLLPRLPMNSPPPQRRQRHPADRLRLEMERMMAEAHQTLAGVNSLFGADDAWAALPPSPALSMRETDDAYELSLTTADADPDAFDVRLDGRLLSITSHQDTRTPHTSSSQHFSSRLLLPGPVEPDALLQITPEDGRLRIRVPKPDSAPERTATVSR